MNGRLYDPVVGRFFSPDKYVQLPNFTQAYNRYSYALNNPLKYVDPTGQWYDDYYDYYDYDDYDDYDGDPRRYDKCPSPGSHKYPSPPEEKRGPIEDNFDYNYRRDDDDDPRADFDYWEWDSQDGPGVYLPFNPFRATRERFTLGITYRPTVMQIGTINLGTTGFGGALNWGAAETAFANAKVWTRSLNFMRIGGNVIGGVGFGATGINMIFKGLDGNLNTSDWVDLFFSGGFLISGFFITNPVGIGCLVLGGTVYGILRLTAGDDIDSWINKNFGNK